MKPTLNRLHLPRCWTIDIYGTASFYIIIDKRGHPQKGVPNDNAAEFN
jgi:hypothetical protein